MSIARCPPLPPETQSPWQVDPARGLWSQKAAHLTWGASKLRKSSRESSRLVVVHCGVRCCGHVVDSCPGRAYYSGHAACQCRRPSRNPARAAQVRSRL